MIDSSLSSCLIVHSMRLCRCSGCAVTGPILLFKGGDPTVRQVILAVLIDTSGMSAEILSSAVVDVAMWLLIQLVSWSSRSFRGRSS